MVYFFPGVFIVDFEQVSARWGNKASEIENLF